MDGLSVLSPTDSITSIRSFAKKPNYHNPLYGYSIETIRAVKTRTIVFRVRAAIFERFLKPPVYREWGDLKLLPVFPPQVRMEGFTKKQQDQILS